MLVCIPASSQSAALESVHKSNEQKGRHGPPPAESTPQNKLDLLQPMKSKLIFLQYRDCMVHSKDPSTPHSQRDLPRVCVGPKSFPDLQNTCHSQNQLKALLEMAGEDRPCWDSDQTDCSSQSPPSGPSCYCPCVC